MIKIRKRFAIPTAIVAIVVVSMLMSVGTAMADTSVHVDWNSPNPDIYVGTSGSGSSTYPHSSSSAWASVSGSGDSASGTIEVSNTFSGAGKKTAWQTADFEGGIYQATVSTSFADPSNTFSGSQGFGVEDVDTALVGQEVSSQATHRILDSSQSYEATGAGLVIAGGSISRQQWNWDNPESVTYTGNAEGNVSGSQGSWSKHWSSDDIEYGIGFGARISGTEGTTYFEFDTSNIPNIDTVSGEYSVSGEARTWTEDSPLDEGNGEGETIDFDWIES